MVLAGLRQSDDFDAEIRRVYRHGADPMDLLYSTQVSTDQDGLVGTDDIGGLSAAWRLP